MGDFFENAIARDTQQVNSEFARFGRPGRPDLPFGPLLFLPALRWANLRSHLTLANVRV